MLTQRLNYYLGLSMGLAALVGWFYLMRQLGLIEWFARLGPESHKGSLNLVAIMLWMLPALLGWKYYLRWLHRRFDIKGQYDQDRHDAQYQHPTADQLPDQSQDTDRTHDK